jgi:carbonic anhydrase
MMNLKKIFANNREWVAKKLQIDKKYFDSLSEDQNPDILYFGCSDSRVSAEELMGVGPGEVFVHRNIANMIPNTDLSTMSTIHYAVDYLKVNHIVVCGHYHCGGVEAAMQSTDLGILNPWLRNIRDVYRLHRKELDSIQDERAKYDRLVELNVQEQCINLIKTPEVQKAYRSRKITVHGWIFDIYSGKLLDLNINLEFLLKEIMEIYHLD